MIDIDNRYQYQSLYSILEVITRHIFSNINQTLIL